MSAFFYGFFLSPAFAACVLDEPGEQVKVSRVFDGDTVLLNGGQKVRLIGANTPELGKNGAPSQPLARKAQIRLQELVQASGGVRMVLGDERFDRYGRTFAHLANADGVSFESILIKEGLAFAVSIPPNLKLRACLNRMESEARRLKLGVWAGQTLPFFAFEANAGEGFKVVSSRVNRVVLTRGKSWWIDLDEVVLLVPTGYQKYFDKEYLRSLLGREIEVKGWLSARKLTEKQRKKGYKSLIMALKHPDALKKR